MKVEGEEVTVEGNKVGSISDRLTKTSVFT